MEVLSVFKYILITIDVIVCIAIIVLALLQAKQSPGASGAVMGGSTGEGNFYEKNKGRTKEGKMKRWTIIFTIIFAVVSIVLGIVWEFTK